MTNECSGMMDNRINVTNAELDFCCLYSLISFPFLDIVQKRKKNSHSSLRIFFSSLCSGINQQEDNGKLTRKSCVRYSLALSLESKFPSSPYSVEQVTISE